VIPTPGPAAIPLVDHLIHPKIVALVHVALQAAAAAFVVHLIHPKLLALVHLAREAASLIGGSN
jgi:hypothetical protein